MAKHTTKIVYGYYTNRHDNEYRVMTDQYSGGIYRVLEVYDDSMIHLKGKDLRINHGFRRARKAELPQFDMVEAALVSVRDIMRRVK